MIRKVFLFIATAISAWAGLVDEARKQVGVTVSYDPSYLSIPYPNGDVPLESGVCTDVVIRAMRGCGIDLQQCLHEDMKKNFAAYPKIWGLKRTDRNIDHRRVPNLRRYFERQGWELKLSKDAKDFKSGDIVTSVLPGNLPHIMIVSDKKNEQGLPFVIHNIGAGAQEEDALLDYPLTGHYRPKLP